MHENAVKNDYPSNHDDPDDPDNHEEVSRELESARKAQLSTRL